MVTREEMKEALAERHGRKAQEFWPGQEQPLPVWEDWAPILRSVLPGQASDICI